MVSPSLIVQKSCSKSMKLQFYTSMANFYGYPLFSGAQTFLALFNGLHIPTFMTFKLDERVWKWGNTPKMFFLKGTWPSEPSVFMGCSPKFSDKPWWFFRHSPEESPPASSQPPVVAWHSHAPGISSQSRDRIWWKGYQNDIYIWYIIYIYIHI